MGTLGKDTVKHVAHLARVELTEKELDYYVGQLGAILDYIGKLKEVNIEGVEPTSHVLHLENVYREDKVKPSLSADEALKNAPAREGDFFKVPPVIEA